MMNPASRQLTGRRACLVVAALCTGLAGCIPERSQSVLPVAIVRNLMVGVTIPASKVLFEAAAESPTDEAGWQRVRASAQALADVGTRLTVGAHGSGKAQWVEIAQAMTESAERAAAAAQVRDAEAFGAAGNAIFEACEGCHKAFLNTGTGG